MKTEPYQLKVDASHPFSDFNENAWDWISDYSDKHIYHILDSIYQFLHGEIEREDLPEDVIALSQEELIDYYQEHFPPMFADCMIRIGQAIKKEEIDLTLDFLMFTPEEETP